MYKLYLVKNVSKMGLFTFKYHHCEENKSIKLQVGMKREIVYFVALI